MERVINSDPTCQVIQQCDFIVLMSIYDYSVMSYAIFVFFCSFLVCSNDTLEISYFSQLWEVGENSKLLRNQMKEVGDKKYFLTIKKK